MASKTKEFLALPENYDVVEAQLDRFRRASDRHEQWAETATTCTNFLEGQQWTEAEINKLESEGRPVVTKNKIKPIMYMMLGYFRQNRYDAAVSPSNDGTGIQEVADSLGIVLKQIAEMNQSDWNDAQVMQDGLTTGRGYWDLRLDFSKNIFGDVKEYVKDPFQILLDPESDEYEPESWGYFQENRWMTPAEIFTLYGEKGIETIDELGNGAPITSGNNADWGGAPTSTPTRYFGQVKDFFGYGMSAIRDYSSEFEHINRYRKMVRVLDCQHKKLSRQRFLVDLKTGVQKPIPDDMDQSRIQRIIQYCGEQGIPLDMIEQLTRRVRWTITAGDRVLHDEWSPYDDYTLVPYFPYFRRGKTMGAIEDLVDPQREINKRAAAMLQIIMTTANSGWIWEENSLEESMKEAIETEGARAGLNIEHREGYNPPTRIEPAAPPQAMKQLIQMSEDDLKQISLINDSAMGNLDRVQSGRAIQARQQQALIGAEVYFDNFSRSKELKARREISIVQNYYTEERIISIRNGKGGKPQKITVNRAAAAGEIVNNLSTGRYNVTIDRVPTGATYQSAQLDEAAMVQKDMGVPLPPDYILNLTTLPDKETLIAWFEEQKKLKAVQDRAAAIAATAGMGMPPGTPMPPVVVGEPGVITVPAGQAPAIPPGNGAPSSPGAAGPAGTLPESVMAPPPPLEPPTAP